jgi:putative tricarboxylic transport membrane protein
MDPLDGLIMGFGLTFDTGTLIMCLIGALLGTLVGVLPGIGPVATMALLLPATFHLEPAAALVMLAGVYYGAQYGSSTTAILLNLPGEASGVITALDGHALAKRGRAGAAIAVAALASFAAGIVSTLAVAWLAPFFARLGLAMTPAHVALLLIFGLCLAVSLSPAARLKALGGAALGIFLGLVGTDSGGGPPRMTFGIWELADGIGFAVVAMGIYGLGEIAYALQGDPNAQVLARVGRVRPHPKELQASVLPALRGTGIGTLIGLVPGGTTVLASFAAFAWERRFGRRRHKIGKGAIEGVATSEAANNAAAQASFVPLLALGLPGNAVMAVMAGAMMLQGVLPGPTFAVERPEIFWTVVASMLVGNAMLLVINLPLIGIWVRLLQVPRSWLFPAILTICAAGAYSLQGAVFDVFLLIAFGALGFVMRRLEFDPTPFFVGFVVAPLLDDNLRRALVLARGDMGAALADPVAVVLAMLCVGAVALGSIAALREARRGLHDC